jgi:starch-binding outer membrane protein, SusD/RagB family
MMNRTTRYAVRRPLAALTAVVALAASQACNAGDKLLSATDPDLIDPSAVNSFEGAESARLGAMERWKLTTGGDNTNGQESTWMFGGLLADEWATSSTFVQNDEADERAIKVDNTTVLFEFRKLNRVRTAVNQAIPAMRTYRPNDAQLKQKIGELYLARGTAEMQLASDFCNGIPLSNSATGNETIVYGMPLKVSDVFTVALFSLDSGLASVDTNSDAESVRVRNALRVIRARALLGNAKEPADYAAAAAAVAGVPTAFQYQHTYLAASGSNALWGQALSGRRYLVGDSIEGNARNILVKNNLPFFSSKDPRVPSTYTISAANAVTGKRDTTKSQDGLTFSRTTTLWGQESPVDVANGIDARLIEAEAKLQANDGAGMIAILNALRAAPQKVGGAVTTPVLPALVDPGTAAGRTDLLFREKAFWTFGRGERLGDLRRLIRQYQRTPDTTFPTGVHYRGGNYGPDVNLPVPQDELNNPNFKGCIDRNA